MRYVIVCPQCTHRNAEDVSPPLCEKCGAFIGDVGAEEEKESEAGSCAAATPTPPIPSPAPQQYRGAAPALEVTQRGAASELRVILIANGRCLAVQSGQVIGMEHPTGDADVRISGVPGWEYVHRRHCTVEAVNGRWTIRPVDQISRGGKFNNATCVNGVPVPPGATHPLKAGDRISLHTVELLVQSLS